jgi:hypothetical protein
LSLLKYWAPKVRFVTEMNTEGLPEDTVYRTTKYPWYHWYLSVWTGPNLGLEITLQDLKEGFRVGFTSGGNYDERGRFIISLFPLDFGIYYYTEKELIKYGMIEE